MYREKRHVGNTTYYITFTLIVLGALISASLSSGYGYMIAGENAAQYERILFSSVFCVLDLMLLIICIRTEGRMTAVIGSRLMIIPLLSISVLSGVGLMLANQSEGENFRMQSLKHEIVALDDKIADLNAQQSPGNLRQLLALRTEAANKLEDLIEEKGGEITQENALFMFIAKATSVAAESVALSVRILIILALNMGIVVMSSIHAHSFCNASAAMEAKRRAVGIAAARRARSSEPKPKRSNPRVRAAKEVKEEAPDNYDKIVKALRAGAVKPSVRDIAKGYCGNSSSKAQEITARLIRDGVIVSQGKGKPFRLV